MMYDEQLRLQLNLRPCSHVAIVIYHIIIHIMQIIYISCDAFMFRRKYSHIQYSTNRKRCKGWIIIMRYAYVLCPCWIDGTFIASEEIWLRKMWQFFERFFALANYAWGVMSTVGPHRSRPGLPKSQINYIYIFAYSLIWKLYFIVYWSQETQWFVSREFSPTRYILSLTILRSL